jgi:purine-nucleoside/S-methyl-5'-thioadenosine phosphorylase / adenosine deaminase
VRVLQHERWSDVPGLVHGFLPGNSTPSRAVDAPVQVHGARVVTLKPGAPRPEADGLVTDAAGACVGVVTADCVPLLVLARRAHAVAAVHAGWRGAAAGVAERALAHLAMTFGVEPAEVEVAMGPAIGPCCYEVGAEVRAAFVARTGDVTEPAWSSRNGRDVLDLRAALRLLLGAAGAGSVAVLGPCTRCSPDYCSFRRDGAAAGRQWSFIGWA